MSKLRSVVIRTLEKGENVQSVRKIISCLFVSEKICNFARKYFIVHYLKLTELSVAMMDSSF